MADESRVLVRLKLLGAQLMARDAKRASQSLKGIDKSARGAGRGLGSIQGGRVQSELTRVQRGTILAQRGLVRMRDGAYALVGALKRVGIAAGALAATGLFAGVKAGADFEQQMANVQSRLDGEKGLVGSMGRLEKLALRLGAKTQFSAAQAAGGMDQLAAAGFSAGQIIQTLPGTLDLAAASGTDLAFAAELQGAAIRGFGLRAKDAGHVADVLARTVNKSALEMADLGETLPYVASTARQTGTSFEQVAAAAGILGNAGIKGSMAGTALRTSMLRLTDPTKKMSDRLASMGLEARELAAQPLPEVIGRVAEGLKKLPSRGEKVGAISAIFGKEAAPSMLNLMAKGRVGIDKFTRALENSEGAAKRAAGIQRNTVKGAFDNLKGSVETAAITLTKRYMPALKRALNAGAGGVNDLVTGLSTGVTVKQKTIVDDRGKKRVVNEQASGAQQAGAAIRKGIGGALAWVGKALPKVIAGARDVIGQVLDALKPAAPFLQNVLLPLLKGVAEGVIGGVVVAFKAAVPIIKILAGALGFVGKVLAPLKGVFEGVGNVIGFLFGGVILRVLGTLPKVGAAFRLLGVPLRIVGGVFRTVGRAVSTVVGWFVRAHLAVARFVGTIGGAVGRVGRAAANIVGGIINKIEALPGKLLGFAKDGVAAIARGLGRGVSAVATAAGDLGRKIVGGIVDVIGKAPRAVVDAIMSIIPGPVRGALGGLLGIGGDDTPDAFKEVVARAQGRAHGGLVRAPLQVVGEHGPELAALPMGSRVVTASDTRRIARPVRQPTAMLPAAPIIIHVHPADVKIGDRAVHQAAARAERLAVEAA